MFDPITDRWYWNRLRATDYFNQDSSSVNKNDWRVGSLVQFNGDLVYTMKQQSAGPTTWFPLWRIYMGKHFPVDTVTTGSERDYIYPPAGDLPPLYNGGYYQWWLPFGATLSSHVSPTRGGWDRFVALGSNMGRDIIVLNDDGTVA
jgi:hypothetical protein